MHHRGERVEESMLFASIASLVNVQRARNCCDSAMSRLYREGRTV